MILNKKDYNYQMFQNGQRGGYRRKKQKSFKKGKQPQGNNADSDTTPLLVCSSCNLIPLANKNHNCPIIRDTKKKYNIAIKLAKKGNLVDAIKNFKEANELFKKVNGNYAAVVAVTLYNIGCTYNQLNNVENAIMYYKESLSVYQTCTTIGDHRLDIAHLQYSIGNAYERSSKYDEALERYYQCLSIREEVLGKVHFLVSKTLKAIGKIMFQKMADIHQELLGDESILDETTSSVETTTDSDVSETGSSFNDNGDNDSYASVYIGEVRDPTAHYGVIARAKAEQNRIQKKLNSLRGRNNDVPDSGVPWKPVIVNE